MLYQETVVNMNIVAVLKKLNPPDKKCYICFQYVPRLNENKMSPQGWYIYFMRGNCKTCAIISPQHVLPQLWWIKIRGKPYVTSPLKAHVAFQFPCFLLFTVKNVGTRFHCLQADYCSSHGFQDVWIQKNKPFPRWVSRKRSQISALVLLCLGAYQLMHEARIK